MVRFVWGGVVNAFRCAASKHHEFYFCYLLVFVRAVPICLACCKCHYCSACWRAFSHGNNGVRCLLRYKFLCTCAGVSSVQAFAAKLAIAFISRGRGPRNRSRVAGLYRVAVAQQRRVPLLACPAVGNGNPPLHTAGQASSGTRRR